MLTEVEAREGGGPWSPAVEVIVACPQWQEGSRVPAGRTGVPGLHISSSLGQTAVEHAALHTEDVVEWASYRGLAVMSSSGLLGSLTNE